MKFSFADGFSGRKKVTGLVNCCTARLMRIGGIKAQIHLGASLERMNEPVNDNDERRVTIITGSASARKGGKSEGVACRSAGRARRRLRRCARSRIARRRGLQFEAELDQIGDMDGVPDDEPHLLGLSGRARGEVSIVTFDLPI